MFFELSKIAWMLLSPLNLIFIIMLSGFIIWIFSKKQGLSLIIFGFSLFAVFGLVPVGGNMLVLLEKHHERPLKMPDRIDGILVLGGTFVSDVSGARNIPAIDDSGERVIEAVKLAQKHPNSLLVFSGGNGRLFYDERTEAEDTRLFLEYIGYPPDNVIYEDESRNTYENIRNSRFLLLPQPEETWILVTSAYHMPRAYAVARQLKWGKIIPFPVDYKTTGEMNWYPGSFNMLASFESLHLALHEFLGIVAYHFTGKITLPL